MTQFKSNVQYQNNFMWTLVSPVVAMLVAIPLSVALVTNIIHKELAADLTSLKQAQTTQMAPASAYQTASATQNDCTGTSVAQAAPASTTQPVVQTASASMSSKTWANPMHSGYAKSYTHVSNSYTSTNTKNVIVDSYNNNSKNYSKTKNVNSGNTASTTVNSTTTNTASGGSVINSSTSANTTSVNGDKNHTGVYNNQSSSATNTTTTVGSNNGNNSHNNNGSYNDVDIDSHDKTKVNVDSHDKTGTFNSNNGNFSHNLNGNKVKVD